jgi:hypothetical protein
MDTESKQTTEPRELLDELRQREDGWTYLTHVLRRKGEELQQFHANEWRAIPNSWISTDE